MTNLQVLSILGNAILGTGLVLVVYAAYRGVRRIISKPSRGVTLEETF